MLGSQSVAREWIFSLARRIKIEYNATRAILAVMLTFWGFPLEPSFAENEESDHRADLQQIRKATSSSKLTTGRTSLQSVLGK